MIRINAVLISLLLISNLTSGQLLTKGNYKTREVIISRNDTVEKINIINGQAHITPSVDKTYFWYGENRINSNKAYFPGKLLHGAFVMYCNGRTIQSGSFDLGLKNGIWRRWYLSGELAEVFEFSDGVLHGEFSSFSEEGIVKERGSYKEGILHGEYSLQTADTLLTGRYVNGDLKTTSLKIRKPKKQHIKGNNFP